MLQPTWRFVREHMGRTARSVFVLSLILALAVGYWIHASVGWFLAALAVAIVVHHLIGAALLERAVAEDIAHRLHRLAPRLASGRARWRRGAERLRSHIRMLSIALGLGIGLNAFEALAVGGRIDMPSRAVVNVDLLLFFIGLGAVTSASAVWLVTGRLRRRYTGLVISAACWVAAVLAGFVAFGALIVPLLPYVSTPPRVPGTPRAPSTLEAPALVTWLVVGLIITLVLWAWQSRAPWWRRNTQLPRAGRSLQPPNEALQLTGAEGWVDDARSDRAQAVRYPARRARS